MIRTPLFKKALFCIVLSLVTLTMHASCPATTPWSTPVNLSNSGDISSNIFSAGTTAGFMAVWADSSNNAHYSFSSNGASWQTGLIGPAIGNVASVSDVFVAGNASGFMVAWMDSSNNAWSSFSATNGASWSDALQINPNTLPLDSNSDVYVSGGSTGFVAGLLGADSNAYASFSTGTAAWSSPAQITSDNSVYNQNWSSKTTRGFVATTVVGNSCMITWIGQTLATFSAYFDSINPFSSTTVSPIVNVGFFESVPISTQLNGYFMSASRANQGAGVTIFAAATDASNWGVFSLLSSVFDNPTAGPWVAANHAGFMSTWVINGSPIWTLSSNNGFNWTPVCSILDPVSTTISGLVGLSANQRGFLATWLDDNDSDAYVSFYWTPESNPTSSANGFVPLLEQKYGPLL